MRGKTKCITTKLEIFILGFPKFFTPNNDGDNDTCQVKGLKTDFSNRSIMNVYDRCGKLIKQLNAKSSVQEGRFYDSKLPQHQTLLCLLHS
ncbi:T9SS type B sorting domain-containing protein [Flavivirga algicola]|uniref:T9SS type B sorting domain-containing protein n=1 Tax=Flavivirga algicola TaxID=2729136 RepID=UPI003743C4CC